MQKLIAAIIFCVPAALAQTNSPAAHPPAAPAAVVSPEVLPDHRVVFRLRAPKATEVTVSGDFWVQEGRVEKLAKGADGVWSLTTEPLPPDLYSYWFVVDGVAMPDPLNRRLKQAVRAQQSMFAVPGDDEAYLEPSDVPHGTVQIAYYRSAVIGRPRSMHVYLPPGYEKGNSRYPVAYLFHGGGDDDWGWVTVGRVNFILDNLIAQGKAKPMIVVMPSVWGLEPPITQDQWDENEAIFAKSFEQEIAPYVESHYRVLPGRENRAAGGLGAGRFMLPDFLWPNLDKFNYAFFVSGGADPQFFEQLQKRHPGVTDNPDNIKRVKFFLGDGTNDNSFSYSNHLAAELKQRNYKVTTFNTNGTHGWPSFRRCFAEWAESAFR